MNHAIAQAMILLTQFGQPVTIGEKSKNNSKRSTKTRSSYRKCVACLSILHGIADN
jgi:hypothetical protein